MWLIVCCFSVSDKHGQTCNVIWLSSTWFYGFESFDWRLQTKSFYSQNLNWQYMNCTWIYSQYMNWNYLIKRYNFSQLQSFVPMLLLGKMLFANTSKIVRTWFLTLQPDIFKLFAIYQSGLKKGHECNMSTWHCVIYLFMY